MNLLLKQGNVLSLLNLPYRVVGGFLCATVKLQ